jgi:hypothetical protein
MREIPDRFSPLAVTLALMITLALLVGCNECETNADCLILCDCDGDETVEALYPHDCNSGLCGNDYRAHLEAGCEELCVDLPTP